MSEKSLNTQNKFIKYRKDFAELLGDTNQALILQDILFRHRQQDDYEKYLDEEMGVHKSYQDKNDRNIEDLSEGWILLTSNFIKESMFLTISEPTIRNKMSELVQKGYLLSRECKIGEGPKNAKMYRINLVKLTYDLNELGYYFDIPEKF